MLVNIKYASCSLIMVSPSKEWYDPPYPVLNIFQTSTQDVLHTWPINDKVKKGNARIMHVGDTILSDTVEAGINENWCLLDNHPTCNVFINVKYLSNIRDAPNGQYLCVHCNAGVTHTNKIGDLPRYSDPVWCNPKVISNILYLVLVQKNHMVTYNILDVNQFVAHIPQRTTFKITQAGFFYHDIRHLPKNKDAHIVVNNSCSPYHKLRTRIKDTPPAT